MLSVPTVDERESLKRVRSFGCELELCCGDASAADLEVDLVEARVVGACGGWLDPAELRQLNGGPGCQLQVGPLEDLRRGGP